MAYNIQYSLQYKKKYPLKQKSTGKRGKTIAVLLVICVCMLLYKQYADGMLKEVLIPDDAVVTVAALEGFSSNLKSGLTLNEAITAFCVEILEHGNVY